MPEGTPNPEQLDILGSLEIEIDKASVDKAVDDLQRRLKATGVTVQAQAGPGGNVPRGTPPISAGPWPTQSSRTAPAAPGAPIAPGPGGGDASGQGPQTRWQFAKTLINQAAATTIQNRIGASAFASFAQRVAGFTPPTSRAAAVAVTAAAGGSGAGSAGTFAAIGGAAMVGSVVAAALAVPAVVYGVVKLTNRVVDNAIARGVAYSPILQAVQITEDLRVRQREIQRAVALGPSLRLATQSRQDFYDMMARYTTPVEGFLARWGGHTLEGFAMTGNAIADGFKKAMEELGLVGPSRKAPTPEEIMQMSNAPFTSFLSVWAGASYRPGVNLTAPFIGRPALPAPHVSPMRRRARP